MKSLILSVIMCISLVGCSTEQERLQINNTTLSSDGEFVGTFKDGTELRRFEIYNSGHNHWVYVVGKAVTVNRIEHHGKTSSNRVEVFIDGVKQ